MLRIPLIGILGFVVLYIYSTTLYPGGSQADPNALGFDWIHNYWCNLTNELGMNGQPNPARPFAIAAMTLLCTSLWVFFIQFAQTFAKSKTWRVLIQIGGTLSMISAIFIFTAYHDVMTTLSSIFGLFVVIGIIREIYQSNLVAYKVSGVFCIALLGLNNYIYYTEHFLHTLPLLQKFTFAVVLTWIVGLNEEVARLHKENMSN